MNLLGKGNNPEFWSREVREKDCFKFYRDYNLKTWNRLCEGKENVALLYSNYKIYSETGSRPEYQRPYYDRRLRLGASSILSLIYPEESKYLDMLQDTIFAVLNEYSWCVPAHQPDYMTKEKSDVIDLFAAETGYTLAQIYNLLGDRLDPLIRDRMRVEIDRRIIRSMQNNVYGFECNNTNNWSAVCMGSVISTVILMRPDLFDEFMPRAEATFKNYLSGFGDDGFCCEGFGYWHYGFGFFITAAEIIRRHTCGRIDYFKLPKVRAIATFIQKMFLTESCGVSFSDTGRNVSYHIGMCHFLKREYGDDIKVYSPNYSYIDDGCCRYCLRLTAATWFDEELYYNPTPDSEACEYYGADAKWMIKRTESYGFAAKAGHNGESHNHNDTGSFIFARGGRQIFTDIGAAIYDQQYFNEATRYNVMQTSSLGHSVPYFGDCIGQKAGAQYAATDVNYEQGSLSMRLDGVYGETAVKSLYRRFSCDESSVTLTDDISTDGGISVTERFALLVKPEIDGVRVKIEGVTLEYDEAAVEAASFSTYPLPRGNDSECYFLDLKLRSGTEKFTLTIK